MPQSYIDEFTPDIKFRTPGISILNDNLIKDKKVEVSVLRLDKMHPDISGNKIFKLFYFLEEAKKSAHKTIITFGGAYSNHLAATSFACKLLGIRCIAFIRGEKPKRFSHTLLFCEKQGMQLEFLSRPLYKNASDVSFLHSLKVKYGQHILIPEGGFSIEGARGASLITHFFKNKPFTHICVAIGTATTFAGIVNGSESYSEIMGFCVLKNISDINDRLKQLEVNGKRHFSIISDYHFGGYAKKTIELISFINTFYENNSIPLDFVYTGKMMFGVYDLIEKDYFPQGSKILCIHTGGLQGNESLPDGMLVF